ncbi:MAG: Fe-S cluster assembly protein SufD [Actinomycetota bacterium]|nr:Fe-S cluster assembly protein SufD [Actinomycetota bacterium]
MSRFTSDAAAALDGPDWLRVRRTAAAERFATASLPTEAEEIWRYSRVSQIDLDAYAPAGGAGANGHGHQGALPDEVAAVLSTSGARSGLLILHNGRVVRRELDPALEARGVVLADARDLPDGDAVVGGSDTDADAFTELNAAFLLGAAVLRVPPGVEVPEPILILHWFDGEGTAAFPRTILAAGQDSQVTVVEHQASADVRALVDPVVQIDVADAARLRYLNVQNLGPRVSQVGYQSSRIGRDASLNSNVVALGGDYARVRTDSRIDGKGGSAELNAVYFTDLERMHDFRTLQDHIAPSTTSNLLFKGAVQDHGRSVYSGMIRVRPEARGTNAFQTNRNLVLSEGAGAESVPNLEILTDDVSCSHASAVGPVDEEQLYYLESRGVPPVAAERLIVMGFLGEVLDRLPSPSLIAGVRATISQRLASRDDAPAAAGASQ